MNQPEPLCTTELEKEFIAGIGSYSMRCADRALLLAGYLEACRLRRNWDALDSRSVIEFAELELYRATRKEGNYE